MLLRLTYIKHQQTNIDELKIDMNIHVREISDITYNVWFAYIRLKSICCNISYKHFELKIAVPEYTYVWRLV